MKHEVSPTICIRTGCPALGVVCKHSLGVDFVPCPLHSGMLDRLVDMELRRRGLAWDVHRLREKYVCVNPDDYPRTYSGDGKHYTPMFPKYEMRVVEVLERRTLAEAIEAIKEHDRMNQAKQTQGKTVMDEK